ncbi:MAG: hypothetical protein IJJ82_07805 [Clostridia bacterium]|nr:hypothetical protein [Clostridia bacterium]
MNKLHLEYIGLRPGTVKDENIEHGLFGQVYAEDGSLLNIEDLELKEISKIISKYSKQNVDIFKTVLSVTEEDSLRYGMDKEAWKNVLYKRIYDIARASEIPTQSIEWSASYHSKKGHPHCHLVYWNKDQNLMLQHKPFLKYKDIRKCVAKEVFKEELEKLYDIKNVSKKDMGKLSKEELEKYKLKIREELKNPDIELNIVDTSYVETLLKTYTEKLKVGEKVYFYDTKNPENFVEISKDVQRNFKKYYGHFVKEENEVVRFKNNGVHSVLYKNNDFTDTGCFLTNFSDIKIAKSKEELESVIKEQMEKEINIDNELREIMPSIIPNNILSYEFREKSFTEITNKIIYLKKIIEKENLEKFGVDKITFKYEYQSSDVKKQIDKISNLILNTSIDCKIQFDNYIKASLEIARILADIDNKSDYDRVKNKARDEMLNKIGNQILQVLKQSIKENREEEYLKAKKEYELKGLEFKLNQELFEERQNEKQTRDLIASIFNGMSKENISLRAKANRLKGVNYNNMTKEQRMAELKKIQNSSGFDWFIE